MGFRLAFVMYALISSGAIVAKAGISDSEFENSIGFFHGAYWACPLNSNENFNIYREGVEELFDRLNSEGFFQKKATITGMGEMRL